MTCKKQYPGCDDCPYPKDKRTHCAFYLGLDELTLDALHEFEETARILQTHKKKEDEYQEARIRLAKLRPFLAAHNTYWRNRT